VITKVEVFSSQPSAPALPLGGTLASDDPIHIRDIQGLGPVKAEIATTPFATSDGELFQGSSVGKRNIVMTMGFNPDWDGDQTVSNLRQRLYGYLLPKALTKLRFFTENLPVVDIEGYVESLEPNIFAQDPEIQCSVICPRPDFIDPDAVIVNGVVDDGTIENVIDYIGTVPTGFELRVQRTVTNPSYSGPLTVTNVMPDLTEQIFEIDPVLIDTVQYFRLSTIKNAKRVQTVLIADDSITNVLVNMTADSVWPELRSGENLIKVAADENDQAWALAYFNRFGGL
jgi:Phage tail protein RIFT-related domain